MLNGGNAERLADVEIPRAERTSHPGESEPILGCDAYRRYLELGRTVVKGHCAKLTNSSSVPWWKRHLEPAIPGERD